MKGRSGPKEAERQGKGGTVSVGSKDCWSQGAEGKQETMETVVRAWSATLAFGGHCRKCNVQVYGNQSSRTPAWLACFWFLLPKLHFRKPLLISLFKISTSPQPRWCFMSLFSMLCFPKSLFTMSHSVYIYILCLLCAFLHCPHEGQDLCLFGYLYHL